MNIRGIHLLALATVVAAAVSLHGSRKSSGEEVTVEGRISGLHCFLEGELCDPDHFWKKGEVAGLVTDDFRWYYVSGSKTDNGVPRDVLGRFFLSKVRVKGTLYRGVATFLRPEMERWQDGKWWKLWPQGDS
ncbi:MAG: hypothetical protein ACE5HZ_02415 [Fidelibacterota bacterium]